MGLTVLKALISALVVVAVAEIAKRSSYWGALLASLPIVTLLSMLWLYADTRDAGRVAQLSSSIFWLVLPSFVFLLGFPWLIRMGLSFWPALGLGLLAMVLAYALTSWAYARWGLAL